MSPRKRTPDKESTETTTATFEPPAEEAATTASGQPEQESNANGQSFADSVTPSAIMVADSSTGASP